MKRVEAIFVVALLLALGLVSMAATHLVEPKPVVGTDVLTMTCDTSARNHATFTKFVTTEGWKWNTLYGDVIISVPNRSDSGIGGADSGLIRLWIKYPHHAAVAIDSAIKSDLPDTLHIARIGNDTTFKPEIYFTAYVSDSASAVTESTFIKVIKYNIWWDLYLK